MKDLPYVSRVPWLEAVYRFFLGRDRLNRADAVWGYLLSLPWLFGIILLVAGPFIVSLVMSLFEWRGFGPAEFVGLYNFEYIVTRDRLFRRALEVTFSFVLMSVPLNMVVAFSLALLLTRPHRGVTVYRAIFYLPSVVTGVAAAFVWLYVFDPQRGPLNLLLQGVFGLAEPLPWLASPRMVLPSFAIMRVWEIGTAMIILLAGLKGIPRQMYEIARIEGARPLQRLWHVTIPLVSPSLFYVFIIETIRVFQVLTAPIVIFESSAPGGPLNSGLFYTVYLYIRAFSESRMGLASALAWILFLIVMSITLVNFLVFGRRVYYE
jgi:multiple sugar transport system permease protein